MKFHHALVFVLALSLISPAYAGTTPEFTSPPTASTSIPLVGQVITFNAAGTDPQGFPLAFTFDYGDGTVDLSGTHVYKSAGNYTVIVTASNCAENVTASLPITIKGFANLWIKKQSIKPGVAGNGTWQAQFIYNADRTTAGIFNPAGDVFSASVGTLPKILVNPNQFMGAQPKLTFKSAKGAVPAVQAVLDESSQTITINGKSETFTDTVPGVLRNLVQIGDSILELDATFDAAGKFTPTSGFASAAFVVSAGMVKISAAGKDSVKFSLLLGDPSFLFPGTSNSTTVRFRITNSAGIAVADKDFTALATFAGGKFKSGKDTASPIGKFSYDSSKGKMSVSLSKATLTGLLSNAEEHVGVEIFLGDQVYGTRVTLFAPKSGSYSTKMGKGSKLTPGTTGNPLPGLPTIKMTNPASASIGVSTNQKVTASFSEAMNASTLTNESFTVQQGLTLIPGTVSLAGSTASFVPTGGFAINTLYTATVTTAAKDLVGMALNRNYVWCFTTGAVADAIAPTVLSTQPATDATGVAVNQAVNATFSEPLAPATINSVTFTLTGPGSLAIAGSITYDSASNIASFKPSASLAENTTYSATLTTGIEDRTGNALANSYTWSFATGAQLAQPGIVLGSAGNFAILAGSTVTNTGPTVINGDLGVHPGSAVTGFPPGIINGATHAGDNDAAQAKNALLAAYNDGAARLGANVLPGNLGGLTFTPGLYKNSSSTGITGTGPQGILTLDAQGDPNAVFIFQMGSSLTTDPGTSIVLAGGAKAANIYWQVGSSATLGTTSAFKGNILADQSITLNTGATLDGRALTRIGAVSLDASTVTRPAP